MVAGPLTRAMQGSPPQPGPIAQMLTDESYFDGMNPIDRLKLSMPSNWAPVSERQQDANAYQNTHDALSVLPWAGGAVAMKDAWDDSGRGAQALGEGRYKDALGSYGSMLANAFGAVLPFHLPNSPAARQAAKDAPTQANIFAGPAAKTADHAALAKAQEMAASGMNRDAIHAQTGWHEGVDGKWRFEIDDSAVGLRNEQGAVDAWGYLTGKEGTPVHRFDGLEHPELNKAYDFDHELSGIYGPGVQQTGAYNPSAFMMEASGPNQAAARSVGLHEYQHVLQGKEGFAGGSNPGHLAMTAKNELTLSPRLLQIEGRLRRAQRGTPEYDALLQEKIKAEDEAAFDAYFRTSGEVEARNVQTRMNMTSAERRAKAPWLTQDVPDAEQIVRRR